MNNPDLPDFAYPSTRYSGSKRRFLDWIWENTKGIRFDSVLDVFGGTGSVSLMYKRYGKKVHYNDFLKFNQIIGTALIENSKVTVSENDLNRVFNFRKVEYPDFIQREFQDVFFLDDENAWLDRVITNIENLKNPYKKAIVMSSLFQACLVKRPYNLFHRANLYIRTADVTRQFGNKTTWEHPFPELVQKYVAEYNKAIFSNNKRNKVIGGYDALQAPNGVDLVYLDPPYISENSRGTDYLAFYHFLEGLADYQEWQNKKDSLKGRVRSFPEAQEIKQFSRKSSVIVSLTNLIERFQDNIIVLSYQSDGIPSKDEIRCILESYGKQVKVYEKPHRYVLSRKSKSELLFVAI